MIRPELGELECPARDRPPPQTEEERQVMQARARYREMLPLYLARLPEAPESTLLVPVQSVRVSQVADTFGAPREGGRQHEGVDLFAPRGTPVVAAGDGFVYQRGGGISTRGGRTLVLVGAGGRRYYYAHLDGYAEGIAEGDYVLRGTVLGYVGSSGNAAGTPPHLHFGIYDGNCDWNAVDPLPLLVDE